MSLFYIFIYLFTAAIVVVINFILTFDVLNDETMSILNKTKRPLIGKLVRWSIIIIDYLSTLYIAPILLVIWIAEKCYKLYNEEITPNSKQERKQTHEDSVQERN